MGEISHSSNYSYFVVIPVMPSAPKSRGATPVPPGRIESVFNDLCARGGLLDKGDVSRTVACVGQHLNPSISQVSDACGKFHEDGVNLDQFKEIVTNLTKQMEESSQEKVTESLAVFDVDGEGLVSRSQVKHIVCGDQSEGLSDDEFEILLKTLKADENGMIRIMDIVNIISSN